MSKFGNRLKTLVAACLAGLSIPAALANASVSRAEGARPIRVLSFSAQLPGSIYYHKESIERSWKELPKWDDREFDFDFVDCDVNQCGSEEFDALKRSNLEKYDVLLMFNASGNVPVVYRNGLIDWLREGHSLISVSSTADGEYDWPEFSDLVGARAEDHYILAPTDPKAEGSMVAINEDRNNPLVSHLPKRYTFGDETYKWKIDPRPDVHTLLSFDNSSRPEGNVFQPKMPLVWCKETLGARTFHMAYGHSAFLFDDKGLVETLKQAIRWGAHRLSGVNCAVPSMKNRLEAVWADTISGGHSAVSSESGALAVVTSFPAVVGRLAWNNVDLTGVKSIEIRAAAQLEQPTPQFPQPQPPPQPAAGGTLKLYLDSPKESHLIGTAYVPPAERWDGTDPSKGTGPQPGYASYTVTLEEPVSGVHSLLLAAGFTLPTGDSPSGGLSPDYCGPGGETGNVQYGCIGSIAWVKLHR